MKFRKKKKKSSAKKKKGVLKSMFHCKREKKKLKKFKYYEKIQFLENTLTRNI